MRNLRLVLLAVTLALLVPLALLVQRSLAAVGAEEAAERRAVADIVFSEMERRLSDLVRQEEARPYDHYRHLRVPEGAVPGSVALNFSPLARPSTEPHVIGWFQIDPDGSVRTPLVPTASEQALLGPGAPVDIVAVQGNEELRAQVASWLAAGARSRDALAGSDPRTRGDALEATLAALQVASRDEAALPAPKSGGPPPSGPMPAASGADVQVPGTTASPRQGKGDRATPSKDGYDASGRSLYASLGRGAELEPRKRKTEASSVRAVESFQQASKGELAKALAENQADALQRSTPAPGKPSAGRLTEQDRSQVYLNLARSGSSVVPVSLDPFQGALLSPSRFLLHRNVLIGSEQYQQGLLLDVAATQAWLEGEVLAGQAEPGVLDLTWRASRTGAAPADGYRHRFARPFDALWADLRVDRLPGRSGASTVRSLASVALAVGLVGALAIHQMVAVTVRFAERRSNFVSAVTHELKTPLTAIRMHAEMLRDGIVPSEEKRHHYHETITAESERLTRLVENVLELSRLERGRREMSVQAGGVGPVLEEAAELLRPHARSKGFELVLDVEPDLPAVRFDRDALLQVLVNLVDNAVKYAQAAQDREIVLGCRRERNGVTVRVRDHGPGVAARHLRHVFDAFYRENELTRRTKGTGIGLALVKGLAERMGGAVTGRNADPDGFEVLLRLPAAG